MDKNIKVIGIGNSLCSDDGVGVQTVERLQRIDLPRQVTLVAGETDSWFCLTEAMAADYVVIIDAFVGGGPPGMIYRLDFAELADCPLSASQHEESLLYLIMQQRTTGHPIQGRLYGIEPASLALRVGLSPPVTVALEQLTIEVIEFLSHI